MLKFWIGENCIYLRIPSKSREGKYKLLKITETEACCVPLDQVSDIIGVLTEDEYVECPACLYGKYCNSARKVMEAMGVFY